MKIFNTDLRFNNGGISQDALAKAKDVVAIDVGFSTTKIYSATEKFKLPTIVSQGEERISYKNIDKFEDLLDDLHIRYNGEEKFIGELAIRKGGGIFAWDENRLSGRAKDVFITGLALATEQGQSIKVMTGLPESRVKDKELVRSYENDLLGHHDITFITPNGMEVDKSFHIDSVSVYGQAQGAYFNRAINDYFELQSNYLKGKIGVIDIGMKTLDFSTLITMDVINNGSRNMGVSGVLDDLLAALQSKYKINHLKKEDMLEIFETNKVNSGNKVIDITNFKNKALNNHTQIIEATLINLWGTFEIFKEIILVGGSTKDMFPYFKNEYNNIVVDEDPQYSVVKGLFKFGAYNEINKRTL